MNTKQTTDFTREKDESKNKFESYTSGLSEQEKIALKIAEQHLETSFDMSKSIGFLEWEKSKSEEISK